MEASAEKENVHVLLDSKGRPVNKVSRFMNARSAPKLEKNKNNFTTSVKNTIGFFPREKHFSFLIGPHFTMDSLCTQNLFM